MGGALHVAIIMDGNGRWALARGMRRTDGHRRGADAVRRTVEAALRLGVTTLTLYAFSSDNWKRPRAEVLELMSLLERFLAEERDRCVEQGIRLAVIGRRSRLGRGLRRAIEAAESATAGGQRLYLRLAVDYSARDGIVRAARSLRWRGGAGPAAFLRAINRAIGSDPDTPEVDLLIRTSGEQRLSDFLLWEVAYAELVFTRVHWPDFDGAALEQALREFRRRRRRFGGLLEATG
jgi:undecaprenyl diphosphate synthase